METEAQRRANLAYKKKNVVQLNVALYPADADLVEYLKNMPNKAEYVRQLIRKDMQK